MNNIAKSKQEINSYLRFISFMPTSGISFNGRWIFSVICHWWFTAKKSLGTRELMRLAKMDNRTISAAITELEAAQLLTGGKPCFSVEHLLTRNTFKMKNWWKGCIYAPLEYPLPDVSRSSIRSIVAKAVFDKYAGQRQYLTCSYIATICGISRRTVWAIDTGKETEIKQETTAHTNTAAWKELARRIFDNNVNQCPTSLYDDIIANLATLSEKIGFSPMTKQIEHSFPFGVNNWFLFSNWIKKQIDASM